MATAIGPCDPRIERTRRLVLEATLALLAESGYGAVTIEAVAARSGVAKSTIYRHWPGRVELIRDAFLELKPPHAPPAEGDVREQRDRRARELRPHRRRVAVVAVPAVTDRCRGPRP